MSLQCQDYRARIPKALLGDLSAEETRDLELHLHDCPACAGEEALYHDTLQQLGSVTDEVAPRHFFLYPDEQRSHWWKHLWEAPTPLKLALAATAVLVVVLTFMVTSNTQIKAESGTYTIQFGKPLILRPIEVERVSVRDMEALRSSLQRMIEDLSKQESIALLRNVRALIADSGNRQARSQRALLDLALAEVEGRLSNRLVSATMTVETSAQRSISETTATLDHQRQLDMEAVHEQINRLAVKGETKNTQTDAILETLIQVAELRLK